MELIRRQFVQRALSQFGKGEAVRTTEVPLFDENDLDGRLDDHRYEPSTFTYFFLDPGMKIRVTFKIEREERHSPGNLGLLCSIHRGETRILQWETPLLILTPNLYDLLQWQG